MMVSSHVLEFPLTLYFEVQYGSGTPDTVVCTAEAEPTGTGMPARTGA